MSREKHPKACRIFGLQLVRLPYKLGQSCITWNIMTDQNPLIVFTPSGKRGRFPIGTPVLTAARSLGVDIDSVCGGRAICGRCQITVGEGEFAKHGITSAKDHVTGITQVEQRYDKALALLGFQSWMLSPDAGHA